MAGLLPPELKAVPTVLAVLSSDKIKCSVFTSWALPSQSVFAGIEWPALNYTHCNQFCLCLLGFERQKTVIYLFRNRDAILFFILEQRKAVSLIQ
jgi:hypothetical protein